jgi:hypothetical protein
MSGEACRGGIVSVRRRRGCRGDVSAGVNLFNPSANTSVFAKFDATLGNNLEGYGGKAGIRVFW